MEQFIKNALDLFHIHLTGGQVIALMTYERELLDWNQKFNLTAIRDVESIRTKHFLDSFSCVLAWGANPPRRLVDVGTGAGFPGLPLKILYPAMQLTLIESIGKKVKFCEHIIRTLGLSQVEVLRGRAEEIGQTREHREKYDWGVARAVANLSVLCEYLLPLTKIGGKMIAQKGETATAEAESAKGVMKLLGGQLEQVMRVNLPGIPTPRYLIVIDKYSATPPEYPRKSGVPLKGPLGTL